MTALLVCCGLATLDVVQVVDRLPAADEKIVARSLDVTFGGPAANAAATAAALGVRTVLVTALGTGPVADLVRSGLAAAGVEVVDLLDVPGTPAVSTVLVTRGTGERAVVSVNAVGVRDLSDAARRLGVPDGATALLVDGHHLGAAQVLAAAARDIPVLLDGGSWKPDLDVLLAHVDHAVLSADFRLPGDGDDAPDGTVGAHGTADLLDRVADLGPRFVAQSAGGGPVRLLVVGPEERRPSVLQPPTIPASEVVDTLGAGDVLHGATAASLAQGHDVLSALADGIARASESVRHPGALGWVP